jgi:hypothetical protein
MIRWKTECKSDKPEGMIAQRRQRSAPSPRRPAITLDQILRRADAWYAEHGCWPKARDDRDWQSIDNALRYGTRGLPGGSTLQQELVKHRGVADRNQTASLTIKQVVAWARAHRRRTGNWPTARSGPVVERPAVSWRTIDHALQQGRCGGVRGSSLAQLLAQKLGIRTRAVIPRLNVDTILTWADAHRKRTGNWPYAHAGPIEGVPGETWKAIDSALRFGYRGLPGGESLHLLLVRTKRKVTVDARSTRGRPPRRG